LLPNTHVSSFVLVQLPENPALPSESPGLYSKPFYSSTNQPTPAAVLQNRLGHDSAVQERSISFKRDYTYEQGDFSVLEHGASGGQPAGVMHIVHELQKNVDVGSRFWSQIFYPQGRAKPAYRQQCPNITHTTEHPSKIGVTTTMDDSPALQTLFGNNNAPMLQGWGKQAQRLAHLRTCVADSWKSELGALSEKFWVDIYGNYTHLIAPPLALQQHFNMFEMSGDTRNLLMSEKAALDDVYQKINRVTASPANSAWFCFFNEFQKLNEGSKKVKKAEGDVFSSFAETNSLGALPFTPMERGALESKLATLEVKQAFDPVLDDLYQLLLLKGGVGDGKASDVAADGVFAPPADPASLEKPAYVEPKPLAA
jgi:hypothetical protein